MRCQRERERWSVGGQNQWDSCAFTMHCGPPKEQMGLSATKQPNTTLPRPPAPPGPAYQQDPPSVLPNTLTGDRKEPPHNEPSSTSTPRHICAHAYTHSSCEYIPTYTRTHTRSHAQKCQHTYTHTYKHMRTQASESQHPGPVCSPTFAALTQTPGATRRAVLRFSESPVVFRAPCFYFSQGSGLPPQERGAGLRSAQVTRGSFVSDWIFQSGNADREHLGGVDQTIVENGWGDGSSAVVPDCLFSS